MNQCQSVDINSKKCNIKRVQFSQKDDNTLVDCDLIESSKVSTESDLDENMNEPLTPNSLKRPSVTVNLEIKKKKPSSETAENSKVLILNTSAVEKISHVIVQPPNYKFVKGNISDQSKIKSVAKRKSVLGTNVNNGVVCSRLRQKPIDSFFCKRSKVLEERSPGGSELVNVGVDKNGDETEMSRNSGIADKSGYKSPFLAKRTDNESSNGPGKVSSPKKGSSPKAETSCSSPHGKNESPSSHTPRKNVDSIHFSIPSKSVSTKKGCPSAKAIPHHKIVAGLFESFASVLF